MTSGSATTPASRSGKRRARRRQQARQLGLLEAALFSGSVGELPWQDVPTEPGYYWYCLIGSGAVRGPAHVFELSAEYQMLTEGRTLEPGLWTYDGEGRFKRADTFHRRWAGPLPRPPAPP